MDPIVKLPIWLKRSAREYFEKRGFAKSFNRADVDTIWIDVGAHLGEDTLEAALGNPRLLVFAFEPNWGLARQIMGRAANFVVLPMAVSETDGVAEFLINASDGSSSLVAMDDSGREHWKDFDLTVLSKISVPTIRLDTFMNYSDLRRVDYLKVDAEGVDLKVVQSAGQRLKDIFKVTLEVDVAPDRLYKGAPNRSEVFQFMQVEGFSALTGRHHCVP